jgi:hypothetical protein
VIEAEQRLPRAGDMMAEEVKIDAKAVVEVEE